MSTIDKNYEAYAAKCKSHGVEPRPFEEWLDDFVDSYVGEEKKEEVAE